MASREDVSFVTQDRFLIEGTVFLPDAPNGFGIICLHQLALDRTSFEGFALEMQSYGYVVLTLDLRAHGRSTQYDGETITYENLPESEFAKIPGQDVEEAKNILGSSYGVDPQKIGIVGASIGANSALMAAARDPRVAFAVALSPGVDFRGLQPEADIANLQKPVLIVVGKGDEYSYQSSSELERLIPAQDKEVLAYDISAHGTNMFDVDPGIEKTVVEWIVKRAR